MRRPSQRHFAPENLDPRLRAGLLGHWIGGGSGLTWFDRSGGGNHGALTNGPRWTLGQGGHRNAMHFDGSDDYVQIATGSAGPLAAIGTGEFSVALWAISTGGASYRFWLANWSTTGIMVGVDPFGRFIGYFGDATERHSTFLADDRWHHYVAQRRGTTIEFFVDGVACGTSPAATGTLNSANATHIGHRPGVGQLWTGTLDDVRIYNRALSAAEIALLAQPSFLPVVPRRWSIGPGPNVITTDATAASATWVAPAATARLRLTTQAIAAVSTWFAPAATARTRFTVTASAALSTWVAPSASAQLARRRSIPISGSRSSYSIAGSRASYHIEGS